MDSRIQILTNHVIACSDACNCVPGGVVACSAREDSPQHNWTGNVRFFGTPTVPRTLGELQTAVRDGTPPVRVVGRGHSFVPVAECTGGTRISLARMNRILNFQPPHTGKMGSITVEGGTTYTEIAQFLGTRGALLNLALWPHFTVAGATATGTHGSGRRNSNLAAHIAGIEFVKADGTLLTLSRDQNQEELEGVRVHLGCLGVVSKITLDVVPYFECNTSMYNNVRLWEFAEGLSLLEDNCDTFIAFFDFDDSTDGGRGLLEITNFDPHWDPLAMGKKFQQTQTFMGGQLVAAPNFQKRLRSSFKRTSADRLNWCEGVTWGYKDGVEMDWGAGTHDNLQLEFFVPLVDAKAAIRAAHEVSRKWDPNLLKGVTFRTVKGDAAWLSPQPVDSLAIHFDFSGLPDELPRIQHAVPDLEHALEPFNVRSHWGKFACLLFTPERVKALYGKSLQNFQQLCCKHDPSGKFRNTHVRQMLFA